MLLILGVTVRPASESAPMRSKYDFKADEKANESAGNREYFPT
jgi:hypothetical protein